MHSSLYNTIQYNTLRKQIYREYEELKQGQNLVATLSKRHGITVFSDIDLALKDTATKLNNGVYRRIKDKVKKNKKAVDKRPHLFHIPPVKRSLVDMINAAYSAGKGEKVIVCIENVPTGATIEGESVSNCFLNHNLLPCPAYQRNIPLSFTTCCP